MVKSLLLSTLVFSAVASAQVGHNTVVLNPNLIDAERLRALPGLTQQAVEAVLAQRPLLGPLQLDRALYSLLTDSARESLYEHLFLPLDLNHATREEIMLIPGISKRMAHEFEEYRPYADLEQFRREIGKYVDADEVARLEQFVFVPINLNTASEEAIASIPGISSRMVHEFLEYRPYADINQFRREIGKYVDADEVARLERYVTL